MKINRSPSFSLGGPIVGLFFVFTASEVQGGVDIPPSDIPLFQSDSTQWAQLQAGFQSLFTSNQSYMNSLQNSPPSQNAPVDPKKDAPTSPGTLIYTGQNDAPVKLQATLQVKGNSTERCVFPKLKLDFTDNAAFESSIFQNADSVRIMTHCQDQHIPDPVIGMLDQRMPHREAFVYRALGIMGIRSLKARNAVMTYIDTSQNNLKLTRAAFFLEDADDAGSRYGVKVIKVDKLQPNAMTGPVTGLDANDLAKSYFAEALVGNIDWVASITPESNGTITLNSIRSLGNFMFATQKDGGHFLIPYDFNLSTLVDGSALSPNWISFNQNFADSSSSEFDMWIFYTLQQNVRNVFPRAVLDNMLSFFPQFQTQLTNTAQSWDYRYPDPASGQLVDDSEGRELALEHIQYFFQRIQPSEFYTPVIASANALAYMDAAKTTPACPEGATLPMGSPVKIIQQQGDMKQVVLMFKSCNDNAVWVDASSISTDYPAQ